MHKILLTILLCISFNSFSQTIIRPGKIFIDGKVVNGFVSRIAAEVTPQEFHFSETENGKFEKVDSRVTRIETDNLVFEPHEISTTITDIDPLARKLSDYKNNAFKGRLYLQMIYSGTTSLYLLMDKHDFLHFFYSESGSPGLSELVYQPYTDNNSKFIDDNSFRNQINFLFNKRGCKLTESELLQLGYHADEMLRMFKKLDACSGTKGSDLYSKSNRTLFLPGVVAGGLSHFVDPDGSPGWKRQTIPAMGLYLLIEPGLGKKGYAVGADFTYVSFKAVSGYRPPGSYAGFRAYYESSNIYASPFLRLYMSGKKTRTYIKGGISVPISISSGYMLKDDYNNTYNFNTETISMIPVGGIGINMNHFSVEVTAASNFNKTSKANYYGLLARYSPFK